MIKIFKAKFNSLDKKILTIIHYGINCCLVIAFIACFILLTYHYSLKSPELYYSGIILIKTSLFFFVDFIICGFAFDRISKEII